MRKMCSLILVMVIVLGSLGCVKSITAVSSLDELSSKAEIGKTRNWYKQSHARSSAAFAMGATLVLFPVAMAMANIPNYTALSIEQIAEFSAAATYDYDSTMYLEWIAYTDGAWAPDYWIVGRGKGMKDEQGVKPVGLIYWNKGKNAAYYEAWMLQKDQANGRYLAWRTPVLKKKGDNLVYAIDESLVLKKAKMVGAYNLMNFTFESSQNGAEVIKEEKDILIDFRALYAASGTMSALRYCDGDREKKTDNTVQSVAADLSADALSKSGIAAVPVK
jgi:hypothetical protein